VLRVVGALVEVDTVRCADDGTPADARQERRETIGVGGIAQEELQLPQLRSSPRGLVLGVPRPGYCQARADASAASTSSACVSGSTSCMTFATVPSAATRNVVRLTPQ
jgi:hypothetical protein